jgi:hypothetical protein
MSMLYIKRISLLILLCIGFNSVAQNNFGTQNESSFAINHRVSKNYKVNFAIRARSFLFKDAMFRYKHQQMDLYHFSTFSLNYSNSLSFGVYYRNRDWFETGSDELRFTEQFNYIKQTLGVRYGHRIRSEQRIFDTKTSFRQRYRFAVDFPLNGEKLDIGEPYLVGSVEALLSISKLSRPEMDQRTSAQIGWQFSETLKLQTGLEYRLEAYNLKADNLLFLLTSAVLKI